MRRQRARLIFWGSMLALAIWSFGIEPDLLVQRQLTLNPTHWSAPPLRIAMASDLHIGAPRVGLDKLRTLVGELNAARPDLILLPGDFLYHGMVGDENVAPQAIAAELAGLRAPLGVYATLGNHDWWRDGEGMREALEGVGIRVLDNAALRLPGRDDELWLVGIGDDMTGHADSRKAFAALPADARAIVMLHDPANVDELDPRTVLALAGHTHGGQVRLPFFGALVTPGRSPLRHAYGWLADVAIPTYVSSGVGTSILPLRFNCLPEYLILRLGS